MPENTTPANQLLRFDCRTAEAVKIKIDERFYDVLKQRGYKQRHAEDVAKAYRAIGRSYAFFADKDQLTVSADKNDPTELLNILGPAFFGSLDSMTAKQLKGWTRYRFEKAVETLRNEGLICTQTRGLSIAAKSGKITGKARYWWLVHPSARQTRDWIKAYNRQVDEANKRFNRTNQKNNALDTTLAMPNEHTMHCNGVVEPHLSNVVLRKTEDRYSENQQTGTPKTSDNKLLISTSNNELPTETSAPSGESEESVSTAVDVVSPDSTQNIDREKNSISEETTGIDPLRSCLTAPLADEQNQDSDQEITQTPVNGLLTPSCLSTAWLHPKGIRGLSETLRDALDAAFVKAHELNGQFCGRGFNRTDHRQLLATCVTRSRRCSENETIQLISDALSYAEAMYWFKERPVRSPASIFNRALAGYVYPTEAGISSDSYGTPDIAWDAENKEYVATNPEYCGDNFPVLIPTL